MDLSWSKVVLWKAQKVLHTAVWAWLRGRLDAAEVVLLGIFGDIKHKPYDKSQDFVNVRSSIPLTVRMLRDHTQKQTRSEQDKGIGES